ncbi:MAG: urease accessory protein UreF [Pseudomonadota bacterium]
MTWLSPVFPTGGFAYSAGLETAVSDGLVCDETSLLQWLEKQLETGSFWNDAVLAAAAYRGDADVEALAEASAPSRERWLETMDQGSAFIAASEPWGGEHTTATGPLPIAFGALCAAKALPLEGALTALLQTNASSQTQAGIRLSLTGQTGAAKVLASLEPCILSSASRAATSTLSDLGGCAFLADICSARHEHQQPRLFLS